jgi:hypothetical protein
MYVVSRKVFMPDPEYAFSPLVAILTDSFPTSFPPIGLAATEVPSTVRRVV